MSLGWRARLIAVLIVAVLGLDRRGLQPAPSLAVSATSVWCATDARDLEPDSDDSSLPAPSAITVAAFDLPAPERTGDGGHAIRTPACRARTGDAPDERGPPTIL